jgi:hypothetical protein
MKPNKLEAALSFENNSSGTGRIRPNGTGYSKSLDLFSALGKKEIVLG